MVTTAPSRPARPGSCSTEVFGPYGSAAAGGVDQATLDLNVTFIAAARGDALLAEGKIIRKGRSVAFGETRVTDTAGTLVAIGRATYMIIQPRS